MYNASTIKTELIGLAGWRQNADSAGWQLTDMLTSSSGLWFNGVHPMLTIDNLISIAPRFQDVDPTQSVINTAFTTWLKRKTEDAIVKAVEDWVAKKVVVMTAGTLLSNNTLYEATGNLANLQANNGKIVGLEVVPQRSKNVIVKINQIGVQFNTNQTVRIYLFKSGRLTEVNHTDIVYTGAGAVQWATVDWELSGEGSYFIAYNEDDITGQAINGVTDHTAMSAGVATLPAGRFFRTTAFQVSHDDPTALWDLRENGYSYDTNFGLNLKTSVRCDYTNFIVEQKDLFKTLITLRVGMDLLREIAFNPESRINRNAENVTRAQLLFEIDGDSQGRKDFSILGQYQKALETIEFDTTGIDKICLSCRKRSIQFRSVGPS